MVSGGDGHGRMQQRCDESVQKWERGRTEAGNSNLVCSSVYKTCRHALSGRNGVIPNLDDTLIVRTQRDLVGAQPNYLNIHLFCAQDTLPLS